MGNQNSTTTSLDFEYNLSVNDYVVQKRYQDFVFGDFYEVKHSMTGELLLMKVRTINDAEKYRQNSQRFRLSHPNLVNIKGFAGKTSKASTEGSHKIFVYFERLPKDLSGFIKSRKKNPLFKEHASSSKNYFSESELESIATQLIDVLEYLQSNYISHGDIRPEACFLNEAGKIMICDRQLVYEEELDINLEKNNKKNFLFSPEMFESLTKPGMNVKEPSVKGDVFSLGMTLLECATFRRSASLYEWTDNACINFSGVINRLDEVQSRYSPKLYQIIAEMLKFDEQSRPDFSKLKRWISGTETLTYKAVSHSPNKKWSGSVGPHINRSNIGPKMNVTSPRVMHNFAAPQTANLPYTKSPMRDSGLFDSSVMRSGRRIAGFKEDEDEVVEFETEESPKRAQNLQQYQDPSHAYLNIINKNHKPLAWRAPNNKITASTAGLGNYHDAHAYINGFDISSPQNIQFKNNEKESTFGAKDLKDKINSESSSPEANNKFQSNNGPVRPSRNFIYPSVETGKPNGYLKASSYDANNPFTNGLAFQKQGTSASTEMDSPTFAGSDRFSASSVNLNFHLEAPLIKPANHRSNSDGLYLSKLNEERRQEEYFRNSAMNKPFNPLGYINKNNNNNNVYVHESPLLSAEQPQLLNPHSKKASVGKLDTSLNLGSYGEIEQWRSPIEAASYNSILSVNTHSPRTGKSSNHQLAFGTQSRPFSPYSAQSDNQKGFAEACHRLSSHHSSNSIDEGNTPQFKEQNNINKSAYIETNLELYGYKTPMERMTYDPHHLNKSFAGTEQAGGVALFKSKSVNSPMPVVEDRDTIRAEINMILQNTTLSKNKGLY